MVATGRTRGMSALAVPLTMADTDREVLETIARSSTAAPGQLEHSSPPPMVAGIRTIARDHGVSAMTVHTWHEAFTVGGLRRGAQ